MTTNQTHHHLHTSTRTTIHKNLGGIDISADNFATEESYIQAVNLLFSRLLSFVVLFCLVLFAPFDIVYLSDHPDTLYRLTVWRVAFIAVVGISWLWGRFWVTPDDFRRRHWITAAVSWSVVGCATGVQIGPFSEPWMAGFLFAPLGSVFFVMGIRMRLFSTLLYMMAGLLTIHVVAPAYTSHPFFPTYLGYVGAGIIAAVFTGSFFDRATREHFHHSLALQTQHEQLEYTVIERTNQVKQALHKQNESRNLLHRHIAQAFGSDLEQLIDVHRRSLQHALTSSPPRDGTHDNTMQQLLTELDAIETSIHQVLIEPTPTSLPTQALDELLPRWLAPYQQHESPTITCHIDPPGQTIQEECHIALFRIFQEAMTNIHKHAQATQVKLSFVFDGEVLRVSIRDNGIGFDPRTKTMRLGLRGARERVKALGGTYHIHSRPQQGTEIVATFPITSTTAP